MRTQNMLRSLLPIAIFLSFAAPSFGDDKAEAKAKFMEGVDRFGQEDYPAALAAFEASYRLNPKPKVLYNIGMCQKALYRYVESIATFEKLLAEGGSDLKPKLNQEVKAALDEMEKLVGKVVLTGAPDGAEVRVDGVAVGKTPFASSLVLDPGSRAIEVSKPGFEPLYAEITVPSGAEIAVRAGLAPARAVLKVDCREKDGLVSVDGLLVGPCPYEGPVDPGKHVVVIRAPGRKDVSRNVETTAGGTALVAVSLEAAPPPPEEAQKNAPAPAPEAEKSSHNLYLFVGGITCTALGAAGLGVGGYYTFKAYSDQDDGRKAAGVGDTKTYNDVKNNRLPEDQAGMIAGFAAGGALVATGVILLILDKTSEGKEEDKISVLPTPQGVTVRF